MVVPSLLRRFRIRLDSALAVTVILAVAGGCATDVSPDGGATPHDAGTDTGATDGGDASPTGALAAHVVADMNLTCAIGDDARVRCWGQFVYDWLRAAGTAPTVIPGVEGATSLAVSSDHACAVVTGGDVLCWGFNTWGQLGLPRDNPDVTDPFHPVPVRIAGLPPASAVAVGWLHSCAVLQNGGVACWGDDGLSEQPVPIPTAMGALPYTATPVVAPGITDVAQLDAHGTSTCVRHHDGSVECWGENAYGEDGTPPAPQRISVIQVPPAVDLYTNEGTSFTLGRDGTVYGWGSLDGSSVGVGLAHALGTLAHATRIVSIAPRICALDTGGALVCLAPLTDPSFRLDLATTLAALPLAREVAIGWEHACAIDLTGHLSCLGENPDGEVGVGSLGTRGAPDARVALARASRVVRGIDFTCALAADGLSCWGGNQNGDVGVGAAPFAARSSPVRLALTGVTDVSARWWHACAVAAAQVYCWGDNTHGEITRGGPVDEPTPVRVPLPSPARQVAVGGAFVCARTDGGVYCWGDDSMGQTGDPTFPSTSGPILIALPGQAAAITAGEGHACAALTSGGVYCWGDNRQQQVSASPCDAVCLARLRAGDAAHVHAENVPVLVPGVAQVTHLVALDVRTCAFDDAGASCWGDGLANVTRLAVPAGAFAGVDPSNSVTVCASQLASCLPNDMGLPALGSVADLTFDPTSGCAVASTGDVTCWGDGSRGQLGTGDGYFGTPVPVTW